MLYLYLILVAGVIPCIALATALRSRGALKTRQLAFTVAAVTVFYLPFDYFAASKGVWTFGPHRVVGFVGLLPVEEYLFYVTVIPAMLMAYELVGHLISEQRFRP